MNYLPISEAEELLATQIVDAAYTVQNNLGPGLLEKIYEVCFCHELAKRKFKFERQVEIPIIYDNIKFNEGLRIDVYVENKIICEIKAAEQHNPVWESQVLSYLKMTNNRLGFLINFNVQLIKSGIKRLII